MSFRLSMLCRACAAAALACVPGGCTHLVAFEQTVVGPSVVDTPSRPETALCDGDVAMGRSAGCDGSCLIEGADPAIDCGRVTLQGDRAVVDVSNLHEVEVAFTACAGDELALRIDGAHGAKVSVDGRALEVRGESGDDTDPPTRRAEFLPAEGCVERALVIQSGRMELAHVGTRICSGLRVDDRWELTLGPALRSVELCFREPPERP